MNVWFRLPARLTVIQAGKIEPTVVTKERDHAEVISNSMSSRIIMVNKKPPEASETFEELPFQK